VEPALERRAIEVEHEITEAIAANGGQTLEEDPPLGVGELATELALVLSQQRGQALAQPFA